MKGRQCRGHANAEPRRIYKLNFFLQEQLKSSIAGKELPARFREIMQPGQICGMNFRIDVEMFSEMADCPEQEMVLNVIDLLAR
jgi:hypothetical protein